ncbi:hypothetical protein CSA56_17900 [candidate division KSB3 bacterium]|uniref:Calcineurin-like phosphoesterase domain-containing protein n=1 Tax=candidate division KSB3 bacterium TaxID=2044937 RepID=A0A2G6K7C7_9BACT|nr:MAG: hypothetical protein CSA56_17900 [candidate division KSB3 bacterium]
MKFIHLSDLHFRSHREDNQAALETLDTIQERYPEHKLIITGDIVDDGHEAQYREALTALRPFEGRLFLCPGNHDYGLKGNLYSRERAERFDKWLSIPLKQGGIFAGDNVPLLHFLKEDESQVLLVALDTNIESRSPFDFACGRVGRKQLDALDRLLSDPAIAHMVMVIFFHHHPFLHTDRFKKLLDARDLARILYGRVHLVLFGHHHVSKMWSNTLGIPYILASDNSPGQTTAREITVSRQKIFIQDITIENDWDIV